MAQRPWITPDEVIEYTEHAVVKARPEPKLKFDISRAEKYIIERTNNPFTDDEKYPEIPEDIKMATILVAEFYSISATKNPMEGVKSENFDDYYYTKYDNGLEFKVEDLDIGYLIDDYVIEASEKKTFMRMRKL